jgi:hypothetical protein
VIDPVGLNPPERVAVSVIELPTGTPGDATVTRDGTTWVTTTDSPWSLHAPDTKTFLPSL